jgi:hypothetical protein
VATENNAQKRPARRFGSEADVEAITGIPRRTLQKHRLFGRGFPFYRFSGRILYDLDEIDAVIRSARCDALPGDTTIHSAAVGANEGVAA